MKNPISGKSHYSDKFQTNTLSRTPACTSTDNYISFGEISAIVQW